MGGMAAPQLVDPRGRPINVSVLKRRDDPTIFGVRRNRFASVIASGLTPETLVAIFGETRKGKLENFLVLARELEKHDAHYRSLMAIRKLAVLRRKPQVVPASEDPRDVFVAEEFQQTIVDTPEWFKSTLHSLDALGKGFSVVEVVWEFSEGQAHPTLVHREPTDFRLDHETVRRVGRITPTGTGFEDLEWGRYVCHSASLVQGSPIDGALAYTEAILYLFSSLVLHDMGEFIERFGTPTLLGEYTNEAIKDELFDGLETLARAGHGVIPKGAMVHALDGARTGGSDRLHEHAIAMLDRLKSKLVLGQTMTSDDGSSRSQAEVHERVEESVNDFDCISVSMSQAEQLFDVWRQLNFPDRATGSLARPGDDEEDLEKMATLAATLADRGAKVPYRHMLEAAGFPATKDDDVLEPASTGRGDVPGTPGRLTTQPTEPMAPEADTSSTR